jgi:hypothetical protein
MLGDFRTLRWGLFEYRVPQGARVEVWDSGIKAHAIAEDTPEAVAERYGVPTWVVAQLNKLVLDEPIGSGKDIVVPRMVFAPTTASLPKTPVASADRAIRR